MLFSQALQWTFRRCAEAYIKAKSPGWRNAKHAQQWENTLATYVYPTIGEMLVRHVNIGHVAAIIEPHWTTKTETINRVRNRIELVLDWATVRKLRTGDNPARWKGNLDKMLAELWPPERTWSKLAGLKVLTGLERCDGSRTDPLGVD